ncbi:MAG TPA: zinc-binding dehydrogenase, partial [Longimicrobiales bacterium]
YLDVAVDVTKQDFLEVVRERTDRRGVNAIVDLVGGDYLRGNVHALAGLGRIALIGLVAGRSASLDMDALLSKRATIVGTAMRSRPLAEKIAVAADFSRDVRPLLASVAIAPVIDRVLPMASVVEAHRVVEANQNVGKVILAW